MSVVNFNVGLLGHVDSGKTSLAKALSSVSSTAAFDKNPQSRDRGITLDLGFSSFKLEEVGPNKEDVQYTLVDCPGHASLIRTIIGGAQIIDLMLLVVDITKGIQTQTAECLVIGDIINPGNMMVVLNKIDLIEEANRVKTIEKMKKKMVGALSKTSFKNVNIVAISANPELEDKLGLSDLLEQLKSLTKIPQRSCEGDFLFSVDHCFSIKGQGTVMTGTVLQGSVSVNQHVEIVAIREMRKVKSIQMFKKPVNCAKQGDRIGLCVAQFESKLLERGLVCTPGVIKSAYGGLIKLNKISYYKGHIATKSKFHISLGHETVMGKLTLCQTLENEAEEEFNFDNEYSFLESTDSVENDKATVFAIIEFEKPVPVVPNCKVLGSKLDVDSHTTSCRMAFHGVLGHFFLDKDYASKVLTSLKIFKLKSKQGVVERANNEAEVICKGMFKKETNLSLFTGLKVTLSSGEEGIIGESFGKSGKFKVQIPNGLKEAAMSQIGTKKKKNSELTSNEQPIKLELKFKKYIFNKKMIQ